MTSTGKPIGGSLANMIQDDPAEVRTLEGFSRATWIKIGLLAALFAWANFWQFKNLVVAWKDPNWSHGFLIPLFSLYLLYVRRHELFTTPMKVNLFGLPILLLGIAGTVYGLFLTIWVARLSMLLVLIGLVLFLAGWRMLVVTLVPILYLALAIPIPGILYERIAVPLQGLAASSSEVLLSAIGVQIEVTALHMRVVSLSGTPHDLMVAEACSGVRSMMAFVALSVAIAYIEPRPAWQRVVLILAGIPITIACNILRVSLTAGMFVIDKPQLGQDIMHEFMGMALLIPALLLLLLLNKLLWSFYVREEDEDDDSPSEAEPPPTASTA